MLIDLKQLIGLPVITRSQQPVGKIIGLVSNNESHAAHQYVIKAAGLAHLFARELLVGPEQVVSLDANKMVIEDLAETALALNEKQSQQKNLATGPTTLDLAK